MARVCRSGSDTDVRQRQCRLLLYSCIFIVSVSVAGGVLDDLSQCAEYSSGSILSRSYQGVCITFVSAKKSWNGANHDCRNYGGLLVQITDQDMQDFVIEVLTSENWKDSGVWIGATDYDKEGSWMWSDGTNITYSNWHPGEGPRHGFLFSTAALEDCALIRVDDNGRWHDYSCGTSLYHHSYMCQYQKTSELSTPSTTSQQLSTPSTTSQQLSTPSTTSQQLSTPSTTSQQLSTERATCSSYYPLASLVQFYKNSCLNFVRDDKSWIAANAECTSHGGLLLQIHSQQDQDFVYESLKSLHWSDSGAWIGANDRGSEGHWRWSDGSPVNYAHWKSGEGPSHNATNDNCAMISVDDGMWYDYNCEAVIYNQAYICQHGQ